MKKNFIALIVILAGVILSIFGFRTLNEINTANSWSKTSGIITYFGIEKDTRVLSKGQPVTDLYANISYNYSVNNIIYSSNRVSFTKTSGTYQTFLDKYSINKTIDVYYNPINPKDAVLEINYKWYDFVVPFVGVLFILLGLIVLVKKNQ